MTLHYRLAGPDGTDVVSTFGTGPATLSLGSGQLAPALEERLLGLTEGARETFELPAAAAFGPRDETLVREVSMALLREQGDPDANYTVGDVIRIPTPDGQTGYAGLVRACGADALLLDFNHPLAGRRVRFDVHLLGVL